MERNRYEKCKSDLEKGTTAFEKSFINGWNKLMDNCKNGGSRIEVVEYDEKTLTSLERGLSDAAQGKVRKLDLSTLPETDEDDEKDV